MTEVPFFFFSGFCPCSISVLGQHVTSIVTVLVSGHHSFKSRIVLHWDSLVFVDRVILFICEFGFF